MASSSSVNKFLDPRGSCQLNRASGEAEAYVLTLGVGRARITARMGNRLKRSLDMVLDVVAVVVVRY
jgi:hypothetical protein